MFRLRWVKHPFRLVAALAAMAGFAVHASGKSPINPYACVEAACGIPHSGAFDQLVLGKMVSAGTDENAREIFRRMRAAGHWQALPTDEKMFSENLVPIVIDSGHSDMTVLMARWEFARVPLREGDLVRYSPHNGGVEPPPEDSIAHKYWDVDGCALILCRAGDKKCASAYAPGVYRKRDGVAISAATQKVLPGVAAIDPVTMFPKTPSH